MPDKKAIKSTKKPIRVVWWLLAGILIVVGAAFAAWHFLPVDRLLEQELKAWLKQHGIEAEFRITRLTTGEIEATDIRLLPDGAIRAERIHATYSIGTLRQGRVKHLGIKGAELSATQDDSGNIRIAGLDAFLTQAKPSSPANALPVLPFDTLELSSATLTYTPAKGTPYTAQTQLTLHGDYNGSLHISEASLPLATGDSILLTDVKATREQAAAPFALSISNIAHITAGKAYFTPLKATGSLELTRDNQALGGIMTITDTQERWHAKLEGAAALDTKDWHITIEQPMTTFETGILQPDMLFPVLRGHLSQVTGGLAFEGRVQQQNGVLTSNGKVTMQHIGGTAVDIPVSGLNGTVALSSLLPPATQGQQRVTVGEILLGLPLKNGRMAFTLKPDGTVIFAPSTWEWAGGTLQTEGASLNLHKPRLPDITLSAQGLALEQLMAGLLKKGISATGKLDGRIPVSFTAKGDAMITKGILSTEGGGVVRYQPDGQSPLQMGQSMQTDLLLSAMKNFHYDELSMTINSKDADELNVLLHVKGRNPELYDGQTIELNINLNGNLLDIVQSGMNIYTLPERLQEQLMQ